ncbi:MAG: hypothetical protein ACOYJZ_04450 [Acutalibacter sp.]|jgi:hypothetical protein
MSYTVLPPRCHRDGEEYCLRPLGDNAYEGGGFRVTLRQEPVKEGCVKVTHTWVNTGAKTERFQPELRIQGEFSCTHYVIPGVSYNGNGWGGGQEPKGLEREGSPWVFDYHRTTIPGCTLSEDGEHYLALFASDEDASSLTCSCSMILPEDGRMIHRLLYPVMERPLTYCARDQYSPGYESYLTLAPGESFTAQAYIAYGVPRAPRYGCADVEDLALELLGQEYPAAYPMDQLKGLCKSHALHLLREDHGRQMFCIGFLPEEGIQRKREGSEFGWCGQNGMYARLFLQEALETGDRELLEIALSNLDAWTQECRSPSGLVITQYQRVWDGQPAVVDTCNQGFAMVELLKAYHLAKSGGIQREAWRETAIGIAEFFAAHWSDRDGFGKSWDARTGEPVDPNGTIGAYLIPGLVDVSRETGESRYLELAKTAYRFYTHRDLSRFLCTAGALDTYCIDKETSGPMLVGALRLYEADSRSEWLEWAKRAGWYFCSWMMHYDGLYGEDTDFAKAGYHTLGGTTVSAQHHHIDPWGALMVPSLTQLYRLTGDWHWQRRARLIWANAIQNIAPWQGKLFHGLWRHPGAQNEAYCHCRWGEVPTGGYLNDWLVAWPQAYCWNTATLLKDEDLR